mmetsp:Transcript_943/g.2408  ORF Transcript_943/g.2408 Transcript_943/m.2408 type:complete len:110 (-) Transcript_943:456-785(-)
MSRSTFITYLIAVLVMVSIEQTQGLAGVVNRFRNNIAWGKSRSTRKSRQENSLVPVQVTMAKQVSAEPMSLTSSISNGPNDSEPFDADSYRQQMTDLVYQRNMQRMFNQ